MRRTSRPFARWMPRIRILLARRPWIYWSLVVAAAGCLAVTVVDALAAVDRQRKAWGMTTAVQVATADIAPGDLLAPTVERRVVPTAMVPPSAITSVEALQRARQQIAAGEILVAGDVGIGTGPAALLPEGWLGISVEVDGPGPFVAGDRVAVLAGGSTLAPDAVVIGVEPKAVVIGVPNEVAAHVAEAAAQRLAVLALAGGR